tara:strand:- start:1207 stop:1629 length:423 start_codon:yes stop_codon:yes gene_type:complete
MNSQIIEFLNSSTRTKLIISLNKINTLDYFDVGKELSFRLKSTSFDDRRFPIKAKETLNNMLTKHYTNNETIGDYLAITNLGIFLEPELKLNFSELIQSTSQNYPLILHWEGDFDNDSLIFKSKPNGLVFSLAGINYLFV